MGGYPPHGTGTRGVPLKGGTETYRAAPAAIRRREVGLHLGRGGASGGGV